MGGSVPGGFSVAKRTVYENGLVLSPRPLYRAGAAVQETWSLIFDNVRFGEILFPDMQTVCAELDLGERLLLETVERYGVGSVHGAMRYVCDAAAERVSVGLESVPDGTWRGEAVVDCDGVDDSEEYRISVAVAKRGGRLEVDFSGTSRQARTCINATALDVKTTVGHRDEVPVRPAGVFTSALLRSVDIVLPEGTIVSALPPDGAVFLYYEQNQAMLSALLQAFAEALGPAAMAGDRGGTDIHTAFGAQPDGTPWVSVAQCGGEIGPFGANVHGDGDSQMLSYLANGIAVAAEAVEADVPVVILRHEIVADSAGPGYNRGGASVVRDSLWLEPAHHSLMTLRAKRAAGFGVNGGGDGRTGGVWVYEPAADGTAPQPALGPDSYRAATPLAGVVDRETNAPDLSGRYVYPYGQATHPTAALSALRYLNHGGGGWGNPFEREPDRVKLDVRDGYVTIEGAARDYGVVVVGDPEADPEGLSVDAGGDRRACATSGLPGERERAELEGSVAIVTGAAGGVGREVVRLLLDAGASVVAEDIDPAVVDARDRTGEWSQSSVTSPRQTRPGRPSTRRSSVRPARHPRQQRRPLPAQADGRHDGRGVGRDDAHQRARRVRALPRGAAAELPRAAAAPWSTSRRSPVSSASVTRSPTRRARGRSCSSRASSPSSGRRAACG